MFKSILDHQDCTMLIKTKFFRSDLAFDEKWQKLKEYTDFLGKLKVATKEISPRDKSSINLALLDAKKSCPWPCH